MRLNQFTGRLLGCFFRKTQSPVCPALNPIDDAIVATSGDAAGRKELEARLLDALSGASVRLAADPVGDSIAHVIAFPGQWCVLL